MERFLEELGVQFSKEFIIEALRFILENNTFQFNDDFFFRQRKGTAMDTNVAPTYAAFTIGYLGRKLYNKIVEKFGQTFRGEFKKSMETIFR